MPATMTCTTYMDAGQVIPTDRNVGASILGADRIFPEITLDNCTTYRAVSALSNLYNV
jgi:hypothetical protein